MALAAWAPETGAGWLYVIGGSGKESGTRIIDTVDRAPILPDGSLGAWEAQGPLPGARSGAAVGVGPGWVVLAGGDTLDGNNSVVSATLGSAGLGPWRAMPALPTSLVGACGAVVGDNFYVSGSVSNGPSATAVYWTRVQPDGTVGPWMAGPPLRSQRYLAALVPLGRRGVLLLGGVARSGESSAAEFARIEPGGGLATWTPLQPLPQGRGALDAVATDRAFYVVGGLAGFGGDLGTTDTVWRGVFH